MVVVKSGNVVGQFFNKIGLVKIQEIHYKKLLGLNSFLIFWDFLKTVLDNELTTQQFIEKFYIQLDKLFDVLGQFSKNPKELQVICTEARKRVKHLEFLDKVCKKHFLTELDPYRKVFEKAHANLLDASKIGMDSYELELEAQNREYFLEAIKIMEMFESQFKNINCTKQKALAYYSIGKFDFKNSKYEDALHFCITSIKLDPDNKQTFLLIDELCFAATSLLIRLKKENLIITKIFQLNDLKFVKILDGFQKDLTQYMKEDAKNVEYIRILLGILDQQRRLTQVASLKEIDVLHEIFIKMQESLGRITQENLANINEFLIYLRQICPSFNDIESQKFMESLTKWLNHLKLIDVESVLFTKIKSFSVDNLVKIDKNIENYQDLIQITKDQQITSNNVILANDTGVIKVRKQAYQVLGDLYLEKNEFTNATRNFLLALEDNLNLDYALRKIDEIYFKETTAFNVEMIPDNIKEKLINFNISEFQRKIY